MVNDNFSFKPSNLYGENNSRLDEVKPLSKTELLALHNDGHDEPEENNEHNEHEEYEKHKKYEKYEEDNEHNEYEKHEEDNEHHEHDFAASDSTSSDSSQVSASAAVIKPATADIVVNYYGFTEEAENAFEYAVTIWERMDQIRRCY